MKLTATMTGLDEALSASLETIADTLDEEVADGGAGLLAEVRQQTDDALGTRVANAWRERFYANAGQSSGPAALVWSKAPRIVDFFSSSQLVTPLGQAFALPTSNVPRGPRGRRLTPIEVEARFNVELQVIPLPSGNLGLVMDAVSARSTRRPGLRAASPRRRGAGRKVQQILMFVLIRGPLRGQQLIDLAGLAEKWGARIAGNIERRLND